MVPLVEPSSSELQTIGSEPAVASLPPKDAESVPSVETSGSELQTTESQPEVASLPPKDAEPVSSVEPSSNRPQTTESQPKPKNDEDDGEDVEEIKAYNTYMIEDRTRWSKSEREKALSRVAIKLLIYVILSKQRDRNLSLFMIIHDYLAFIWIVSYSQLHPVLIPALKPS